MSNTTTTDGGPAYPVPMVAPQGDYIDVLHAGLTMRDYFAAAALNGSLANHGKETERIYFGLGHRDVILHQAAFCYAIADAMLAARAQGGAK